MKQNVRDRRSTIALMVLHLALALPLAYFLNIWADEASTLYTTEKGLAFAFETAASHERQAPLYFWILSIWRSVDNSIFFARIFSIICSLAAIWVTSGLFSRLFERRSALLATAFIALHPFLLWASVEIRVYSLVILLSAVLISSFIKLFLLEKTGLLQSVLFAVAAIAGIYTNYYLGFLLIGFLLVLLFTRRWKQAWHYLALMIGTAICIVPLGFSVISQLAANTSGFQEPRSIVEGVRYLWHHCLTFLSPTEVFPDRDLSVVDVVRIWIVRVFAVAAAVLSIISRKHLSRRTFHLLIINLSVFSSLLFAYIVLGGQYIEIRHAAVAFVPLVGFIASLIDDLGSSLGPFVSRTAFAIGSLAVMASFTYAHLTLFPGMTKRGDWARIGAYIQENEGVRQPILVFTVFDTYALPYHYQGKNIILPDERLNDFPIEEEFGTPASLKRQIDFLISEIPAEADEIWLAVNEKCLITEACLPLENYLMENYTIQKEQQFYQEKVFLLRRKAK